MVSGGSDVVVLGLPHQVRLSHFLSRLYKASPALQPKGGEHIYLSSRRNMDP